MNETPSFLKEAAEKETSAVTNEVMSTLSEMIKIYEEREAAYLKAEAYAKALKEEFNTISCETIPTFLLQHGFKDVTLKDGRKVTIKEDISVTIKDEIAFRNFLTERGESDIIKSNYAFPRMSQAKLSQLADFLIDNDYDYDVDESVHPSTKKKYFKELLAEIPRANLPEWVKIFDIRSTKIK